MTFFDNGNLIRTANLSSLKIRHIFCGYVTPGCWKSSIPVNRLIYVFENGGNPGGIGTNDDFCPLHPHSWLFIPAFHEVRHEEYSGLKLISIHFNVEICSNVELFSECKKIIHGTAPEMKQSFLLFMDQTDKIFQGMLLKSVIYLFMGKEILPVVPSTDKIPERIYAFSSLLDVIRKDPCKNLTVPEMAKIMKMGKDSFIKQFLSKTGVSPKLFFNRIRAASAAEALNNPDARIRDVAFRFGFANEFYFSRFFKRHFGLSPKAYRIRFC